MWGICQMCGCEKELENHHIEYGKWSKGRTIEICKLCHSRIHEYGLFPRLNPLSIWNKIRIFRPDSKIELFTHPRYSKIIKDKRPYIFYIEYRNEGFSPEEARKKALEKTWYWNNGYTYD